MPMNIVINKMFVVLAFWKQSKDDIFSEEIPMELVAVGVAPLEWVIKQWNC